jgi:hypothetical protein
MLRAIILGILVFFPLISGAEGYDIKKFKAASLEIALGNNEYSVSELLGTPDAIESGSAAEVKMLNAEKGLVYWHPEWATVHLLVGIKSGKVTGVSMCSSMGSKVQTIECQSPVRFWESAE